MPNPTAAYMTNVLSGGQDHNTSPNVLGRTPDNLISEGTAYSPTEILNVSDMLDATKVTSPFDHPGGTTGRPNHLFVYNITADLAGGSLTGIDAFIRFGHTVSGNHFVHRMKTYLWENDSSWLQIAVSNSAADPRNMNPLAEDGDLTRFVDSNDDIYLLFWDWEGTFQTGGVGCVLVGEPVQQLSGTVLVEDIVPGQMISDWKDQSSTESMVTWLNHHYTTMLEVTRLTTAEGTLALTSDHPVLTDNGFKSSSELEVGDLVRVFGGGLGTITATETSMEIVDVIDVVGEELEVFFCGTSGIAVGIMRWYT